jgi:hypothetical protein
MRAGDRHDALFPASDQLSQRIRATHNRQTQRPGALQFGVIARDRGGHDDRPNAVEVPRIVAPKNRNPQGGQVVRTSPGSI